MITKIIGTGSFLPRQVVSNDDLAKIMDTSDEWIFSRTGIKERRLAKEETTSSMSAEAAKKAMEAAGIQPEEVDLIIAGTITGDYVTPSTACEVQAKIGALHAAAFDINAACSGFMFAMHTAHAYLQTGIYRTAIVLGAETLSKIMDWGDRSTCVLFGDGAGAAVLRSYEKEGSGGILAYEQRSDGARGMALSCEDRRNNNPLVQSSKELSYVHMDGQEVYKFAVSTVPASIQRVLKQAGIQPEEVKYFVLHQANIRIIQSVAKRLNQDVEKFPLSLDHCGNISAASIPILLDEMNRKGRFQKGDKIVMSGFGGGLTWASTVMEW